ncbi:MAG TPA: DUF952 domain-containing protein [Acidimicrobiales bacterium]|nr:DUF952 domain-containing protein [Acidimicrobiales bacterium]
MGPDLPPFVRTAPTPGRPLRHRGSGPRRAQWRIASVFHIADPGFLAEALASGSYRGSSAGLSLDDVGFVHCARPDQLAGVVERYYRDADEIVVLVVDTDRLGVPLREEPGESGASFPHLYGPLPMSAVVRTVKLRRTGGAFDLRTVTGAPS